MGTWRRKDGSRPPARLVVQAGVCTWRARTHSVGGHRKLQQKHVLKAAQLPELRGTAP